MIGLAALANKRHYMSSLNNRVSDQSAIRYMFDSLGFVHGSTVHIDNWLTMYHSLNQLVLTYILTYIWYKTTETF